jgi:heterogeneous nuclear ribonucleoprotein F/H
MQGDGNAQLGFEAGLWGTAAVNTTPVQTLSSQTGPNSGTSRGGPLGIVVSGGRGGGPDQGNSGGANQARRTGGGIQVGEHTGFLRMRGLPFSAKKEDIAKFFESHNPILDSIVLTYRSDGRATGEAYVGFEAPEASNSAMDLHRKSMGNRYIELFLSNKEEHGRALTRFGNR